MYAGVRPDMYVGVSSAGSSVGAYGPRILWTCYGNDVCVSTPCCVRDRIVGDRSGGAVVFKTLCAVRSGYSEVRCPFMGSVHAGWGSRRGTSLLDAEGCPCPGRSSRGERFETSPGLPVVASWARGVPVLRSFQWRRRVDRCSPGKPGSRRWRRERPTRSLSLGDTITSYLLLAGISRRSV